MTPEELAYQDQIDDLIVRYVRQMAPMAPVTTAAVHRWLRSVGHRRISEAQVEDRLGYLVGTGDLKVETRWEAGQSITRYDCTALGRDRLDGRVPPRGWDPK